MSFEVAINTERCKGCGLCIALCPAKIMVEADRLNASGTRPAAVLRLEDCRGCRQCAVICPEAAIAIYRLAAAPPTRPRTPRPGKAGAAKPATRGPRQSRERTGRG